MNRVMCKNGHFYDGEKYQECPHCADGVAPIAPSHFDVVHQNAVKQDDKKEKKEKKGLFKKKEVKVEVLPVQDIDKTERLSDKTERLNNASNGSAAMLVNIETEPVDDLLPYEISNNQEAVSQQQVSQQPVSNPYVSQKPMESVSSMKPASLQADFAKAMEPVKAAPSSPTSATAAKDLDDMKTVGYYSTGKATEPPVGYLICTKGDDYGTGFLLKSGNNTIGRSASMDVVVMDMKVSREKQAFVMYEPHKREFYVKPGEGSGLCYFNGDVVLGPMKMNAYDKIGVGDTELMLIPVCTQEFSWDDL